MRKRTGFLFCFFQFLWLAAVSSNCFASASESPVYFDPHGFTEYSGVSNIGSASAPKLMQYGAGVSLAYVLSNFLMLGMTSDFHFINQYSAVDTKVGNYRGTRFNYIAPMIGLRFEKLMIKLEDELLGSYTFANPTVNGGSASYLGPSGAKIAIFYRLTHTFAFGLQYETLSFGAARDSTAGTLFLTEKPQFRNFGGILAVVF